MNNQEPQSRIKRYDFNQGTSNQSRRPPHQFRVWPWIVLLIVIIIVLVGGIKWFNGHDNHQPNQAANSQQIKNSSSHQSNKNSQTSSSATTNSATHHSNSHQNHQQANNHPKPEPNQPPSDGKDVFAGDHQFGSVQDAQSWAQATQNGWLQEGYTNYTINSDGQGYYILRFTK